MTRRRRWRGGRREEAEVEDEGSVVIRRGRLVSTLSSLLPLSTSSRSALCSSRGRKAKRHPSRCPHDVYLMRYPNDIFTECPRPCLVGALRASTRLPASGYAVEQWWMYISRTLLPTTSSRSSPALRPVMHDPPHSSDSIVCCLPEVQYYSIALHCPGGRVLW